MKTTAPVPSGRLQGKYQEIADLTRAVCMGRCPEPGGCCRPDYCSMAQDRAEAFGIVLPVQHHPMLPLMGPKGCVAPPHLRPLCAVHVCEGQLLMDPALERAYLALRDEVCTVEEAEGPGWPEGMVRHYRE